MMPAMRAKEESRREVDVDVFDGRLGGVPVADLLGWLRVGVVAGGVGALLGATVLSDRPVDQVVAFILVPLVATKIVLIAIACLASPLTPEEDERYKNRLVGKTPTECRFLRAGESVFVFAVICLVFSAISAGSHLAFRVLEVSWAANFFGTLAAFLGILFLVGLASAFVLYPLVAAIFRDGQALRWSLRWRLVQVDTVLSRLAMI